jgi:hypothetical protein
MSLEYAPAHIRYYIDLSHVGFDTFKTLLLFVSERVHYIPSRTRFIRARADIQQKKTIVYLTTTGGIYTNTCLFYFTFFPIDEQEYVLYIIIIIIIFVLFIIILYYCYLSFYHFSLFCYFFTKFFICVLPDPDARAHTVPEAPPQNVTAEAISPTSISVQWMPPLSDRSNGQIIYYKVMATESGMSDSEAEPYRVENVTSITLEDLKRWTEYKIWVLAGTSVGDGPTSTPITVRTREDGKHSHMAVNFILHIHNITRLHAVAYSMVTYLLVPGTYF